MRASEAGQVAQRSSPEFTLGSRRRRTSGEHRNRAMAGRALGVRRWYKKRSARCSSTILTATASPTPEKRTSATTAWTFRLGFGKFLEVSRVLGKFWRKRRNSGPVTGEIVFV